MSRRNVQQQFGENADRYVTSKVHAQGASLAEMVRLAQPKEDWLALDVASGGGHSALAIARHVRQVIAVDITFPMLQAARAFIRAQNQANISWVQADGGSIPFGDDRFDLITCRVALHHFPQQAAAIREWARCLKPGGRLVLVDNIGPEAPEANRYVNVFEQLRDPSHGRLYPPAVLAEFIQAAGLNLMTTLTLRKPMLFHPWMERMQVSPTARDHLTQLLWESSGPARDFLNPRGTGPETTFDLWEGIFLAQKPEKQKAPVSSTDA